jgi:peptide deformylase
MTVRTIRLYPDPVLREVAQPIREFDAALRELVEDMIETMHQAPGIGLAAPQIGVGLRVAVVDLSVGEDPEELLVLVNPEIDTADASAIDTEGCLSIPDFTDKVLRPEALKLRARDAVGNEYELEAAGLLARAIQHEIDHLDGVLFVDYLRGLRRERAKRFLKRLSKESASAASEVPIS